MAKKTSKKTPSKAKPAKTNKAAKPALKKASKAPGKAEPKASGGSSLAPRPVSTGPGPSAAEVGAQLIAACNRGDYHLNDKLWSPGVVSIEGVGVGLAWHGRKAVDAKNAGWNEGHTIHGVSAEGPFVGSTGFTVRFRMDVEDKSTRKRVLMHEVGVYTVKNGKIVQEEFMYGPVEPVKVPATQA